MNTFETISGRFSYRGAYENAPVPREHLKMILQAGLDAPSGCNKQTTSLIAVDDPAILSQLSSIINATTAKTCTAMICVLTQRIIAYEDRTFYIQDYSAAIENMLLAIHDLGYASCWYEGRATGPIKSVTGCSRSWAFRRIMSWSASCPSVFPRALLSGLRRRP